MFFLLKFFYFLILYLGIINSNSNSNKGTPEKFLFLTSSFELFKKESNSYKRLQEFISLVSLNVKFRKKLEKNLENFEKSFDESTNKIEKKNFKISLGFFKSRKIKKNLKDIFNFYSDVFEDLNKKSAETYVNNIQKKIQSGKFPLEKEDLKIIIGITLLKEQVVNPFLFDANYVKFLSEIFYEAKNFYNMDFVIDFSIEDKPFSEKVVSAIEEYKIALSAAVIAAANAIFSNYNGKSYSENGNKPTESIFKKILRKINNFIHGKPRDLSLNEQFKNFIEGEGYKMAFSIPHDFPENASTENKKSGNYFENLRNLNFHNTEDIINNTNLSDLHFENSAKYKPKPKLTSAVYSSGDDDFTDNIGSHFENSAKYQKLEKAKKKLPKTYASGPFDDSTRLEEDSSFFENSTKYKPKPKLTSAVGSDGNDNFSDVEPHFKNSAEYQKNKKAEKQQLRKTFASGPFDDSTLFENDQSLFDKNAEYQKLEKAKKTNKQLPKSKNYSAVDSDGNFDGDDFKNLESHFDKNAKFQNQEAYNKQLQLYKPKQTSLIKSDNIQNKQPQKEVEINKQLQLYNSPFNADNENIFTKIFKKINSFIKSDSKPKNYSAVGSDGNDDFTDTELHFKNSAEYQKNKKEKLELSSPSIPDEIFYETSQNFDNNINNNEIIIDDHTTNIFKTDDKLFSNGETFSTIPDEIFYGSSDEEKERLGLESEIIIDSNNLPQENSPKNIYFKNPNDINLNKNFLPISFLSNSSPKYSFSVGPDGSYDGYAGYVEPHFENSAEYQKLKQQKLPKTFASGPFDDSTLLNEDSSFFENSAKYQKNKKIEKDANKNLSTKPEAKLTSTSSSSGGYNFINSSWWQNPGIDKFSRKNIKKALESSDNNPYINYRSNNLANIYIPKKNIPISNINPDQPLSKFKKNYYDLRESDKMLRRKFQNKMGNFLKKIAKKGK